MRLRDTILTGAASYLRMGSQVLTGLATIPLALHFLDSEQFGLWAFVSQSLGYLMLMDLGVGHALGRLLAEPLHTGDEKEWNGWFNLALLVFTVQAVVILGLGVLLTNPLLHWFPIPTKLVPEARELWLAILILNVVMLPLRVFRGIVGAQNRTYWAFTGETLGAWFSLLVFFIFLKTGWGVLAYGWGAAARMCFMMGLPLAATVKGPHRFRLSFRNLPWRHLRELFGFSSSVFVISIAGQIAFMSQSLIITKFLGLAAVASFTVCSRVPMLLLQAVWQPFDACVPRWQIFWAKDQKPELRTEFRRMFRFALGLAAVAALCCFAMNRWFVFVFGKESLYAGKTFDFFFAVFVFAQTWNHCMGNGFYLSKRMKGLAAVVAVNVAIFLTVAMLGAKFYGLVGYIAFTTCWVLVSVGMWYQNLNGPKQLGLRLTTLLRDQARTLLVFPALMIVGWLTFHEITKPMLLLLAEAGFSLVAVVWFALTFRQDVMTLINRLQRAWQKRAASPAETLPLK